MLADAANHGRAVHVPLARRGSVPRIFRLALIHMKVGADKAANLKHAQELIQEAARNKADIVALPVSPPCRQAAKGRWLTLTHAPGLVPPTWARSAGMLQLAVRH